MNKRLLFTIFAMSGIYFFAMASEQEKQQLVKTTNINPRFKAHDKIMQGCKDKALIEAEANVKRQSEKNFPIPPYTSKKQVPSSVAVNVELDGKITSPQASQQLVPSKYGNLQPVFFSIEDKGRERFRKLSDSGAFIVPRSKTRIKSMQERVEKEKKELQKETAPNLDLYIPPYKPKRQAVSYTADHAGLGETITRNQAFREIVSSKNITARRRTHSYTSAERLIREASSKTEKKFVFVPRTSKDIPVHVKFQFDIAVNKEDVATVERLLHNHKEELQSYYPASLLIQHRQGYISLNSFEIDKNKFGSTVLPEKHKKIVEKLDYSDVTIRDEFNQAVNARNVSKVLQMCDDNQSLRENCVEACFLDDIYNHFRTQEDEFFIHKERMHSDIDISAFKEVALGIAQKGGNIAFENAFKKYNLA
jgi:hypothetical protein